MNSGRRRGGPQLRHHGFGRCGKVADRIDGELGLWTSSDVISYG
jgi:hypothetical protein